jgi:uncharacterized membrane protein
MSHAAGGSPRDALSDDPHDIGRAVWSKNRIEALTDGIYAVAMTLLVIDLKVPDRHAIHSPDELDRALLELVPKGGAWLISFFVLAMFWVGHHRLLQHVRVVDMKLLWRNIHQLMLVSLLPFSASLLGEYTTTRVAQYVYNANMILLAATAIWQLVHVHRHPEMQSRALGTGAYHAALLRNGGLVVAGLVAIAIARATGSIFATYVYIAMWPLGLASRRIAARDTRRAPSNVPLPPRNGQSPSTP